MSPPGLGDRNTQPHAEVELNPGQRGHQTSSWWSAQGLERGGFVGKTRAAPTPGPSVPWSGSGPPQRSGTKEPPDTQGKGSLIDLGTTGWDWRGWGSRTSARAPETSCSAQLRCGGVGSLLHPSRPRLLWPKYQDNTRSEEAAVWGTACGAEGKMAFLGARVISLSSCDHLQAVDDLEGYASTLTVCLRGLRDPSPAVVTHSSPGEEGGPDPSPEIPPIESCLGDVEIKPPTGLVMPCCGTTTDLPPAAETQQGLGICPSSPWLPSVTSGAH